MGLGGWLTDMVTSSSGVTIDLHGKRVFAQHTLMVKGLEHALKDTEGIDLVDISSGADGYRIRAKVNGKEVGALLVPELIRWSNGVILVNAATPAAAATAHTATAARCCSSGASGSKFGVRTLRVRAPRAMEHALVADLLGRLHREAHGA